MSQPRRKPRQRIQEWLRGLTKSSSSPCRSETSLTSERVPTAIRAQLVRTVADTLTAIAACRLAGTWQFGVHALTVTATAGLPHDTVLQLLAREKDDLDLEALRLVLAALGSDYSILTARNGRRRSIPDAPGARDLASRLRRLGQPVAPLPTVRNCKSPCAGPNDEQSSRLQTTRATVDGCLPAGKAPAGAEPGGRQ